MLNNMTEKELDYFIFATTTSNSKLRLTAEAALAKLQAIREQNAKNRAEYEKLAASNGAKIAARMLEVAGTCD